jgi:hypothetical protein
MTNLVPYIAIVTVLLGGVGWLIRWMFEREKRRAEVDKDEAVAAQTKIVSESLHLELHKKINDALRNEITHILDDKKVLHQANVDLIEINRQLIEANEGLRREVGELKREVHELRVKLIELNIVPIDVKAL